MSAIGKIKDFIGTQEFLAYLIGLVLATLFIGYAPSSIALAIFIFFSIRYSVINKSIRKIDFALLLPVLLYFLFTLSLVWTVNINFTKIGLERTVSLFLVPLAFNFIPKISKKNLKVIFNIHSYSNILLGVLFLTSALFNFTESKSISDFTYHKLVSILDLNAIYVSLSFSISIFYLVSKEKKSVIDKTTSLFFLAILLLLSSKTMVFVLFLSVFAYIYCNKINKLNKKKIVVFSIIGFLVISLGSITLTDRFLFEKDTKFNEVITKKEFGNIYPWTGSSIRVLQLRILKEQIEEEGIFWKGFGLFASRDNIKKRHQEFDIYPEFHEYNYHNQYAQILGETGVVGLILLLIMLALMFIAAFRANSFLFIMISITIMMLFFTESLLWRQQGLFIFIIFYCLIISNTLMKSFWNITNNINI